MENPDTGPKEDQTWLQKEIDRKTAAAEERGDSLPILSGLMNAIFG